MPKFTVEKSVHVTVPADKVFGVVRDFRKWPEWSPWLISEPGCKVGYADDGRSYSWDGNVVGSGEMVVTGEGEPGSIDYDLTFLKPWKSESKVRFTFVEKDGGTEITWTMHGALPFFMFWMKPMMIAFVGMDYDRGLAMLKDFLEKGGVPSELNFPGVTRSPGFSYVGVKNACAIKGMADAMERDFKMVKDWVAESGTAPSGKPFSIYHKWGLVKGVTEYTVGFPVADVPGSLPAGLVSGEQPTCDVYPVKHTGAYRHLGNAWSAGVMHGRAKVFAQSRKIHPFEVYENDPSEVSEDELLSVVNFPVK